MLPVEDPLLGLEVPLAPGLVAPMLPEFPFFSLQVSETMSTLATLKVLPELPVDAAEVFDPAPLSHIPFTATS